MFDRNNLLAAGAVLILSGVSTSSHAADEQEFTQIERGRYLTILGDCAACHTVPGSGKSFAGGRPIETPFGNVIAPNITPDRETGIGAWTDAEFISALKSGVGRGGVLLYPAMPYAYYTKMTDEDALAIRAYLSTVEPVRNKVVSNQLPFPFNIRQSLRAWNALYFNEGTFKPDGGKSPEWNRGAYLVQGPMHCGACHTPKTMFGGDIQHHAFEGYSLQGWFAPNITNDPHRGLGSWSVSDVVEYLKTGHNKASGASGPMAEEVEMSSAGASDDDLKAIATYLKDQPGQTTTATAISLDDPSMKAGMAIYDDVCSACHSKDGKGIANLFPALNAAPTVQSNDPASLIRVVINGAKTASTAGAPTGPGMPSYGWQLNDAQVAAVLTYVRNAWGNAASAVSASDVSTTRAGLLQRAD